ncbi:MAG: TlpA family protein disulfide reductase [Clostridia bacterium]|nr:TlpA family protein disulfide reductase [Clostridia bacterium]
MKLKILLLAALLVILMVAAVFGYRALTEYYQPTTPSAQSPTNDGDTQELTEAPDFTVKDGDGNEVKLSDFEGKPVILNFWATWCGPCTSELPHFNEAYAEYADEVAFLMINLTDGSRETIDGVKEFIADNEYTFPVYYDTTLSAASTYGAYSIPLTVLVDADGMLLGGQVGALSAETLEAYIQYLTGESE